MFEDLLGPTVPTRHLQVDWDRYSKPSHNFVLSDGPRAADIWRDIYAQKREGETLAELLARLQEHS